MPLRGSLENRGSGRLTTFSDGVFAIAATLLILNVDTYVRSCAAGDAGLAGHLTCGWPSYIAYIVSFLTIGIIWANHHTVMDQIARADRTFLMLSIGFLMVVAFIPFPTGLVAENINGPGAVPRPSPTASRSSSRPRRSTRSGSTRRRAADCFATTPTSASSAGYPRTFVLGPWIYVGATVLAAIAPVAGAIAFVLLALFWVIESSVLGRDRAPGDVTR